LYYLRAAGLGAGLGNHRTIEPVVTRSGTTYPAAKRISCSGTITEWGHGVGRLRGIKGHEAVRAFVRAGGVMRQGKGDHVNIKMPSGAIITLPWSKELKIGLLTAAIKKAGLTEEEFLALL
jgi:predicted RNA binding protein YcfA (HicA-like mRNA interferase family)